MELQEVLTHLGIYDRQIILRAIRAYENDRPAQFFPILNDVYRDRRLSSHRGDLRLPFPCDLRLGESRNRKGEQQR
jgi:hypothetical protein